MKGELAVYNLVKREQKNRLTNWGIGLTNNNNLFLTEQKGRAGEILAGIRGSTDGAQRGPYTNDRGPIFPSTPRAS